jgi:hypothetical protein
MALFKLSRGLDNATVGETFGYGEEIARKAFIIFCKYISDHASDFIVFPTGAAAKKNIEEFKKKGRKPFPSIVGVIDGTHVLI